MDNVKKYSNFIIIGVFLAVYYTVLYVLKWPFVYLVGIYAAGFVICAVLFRAGLFAGLAGIFYSAGKRDKAKAMFERAFRHKSKNPVVYLNYAVMMLHNGDAVTSMEYAKKALAMKPPVMTEKNARLTVGSCQWVMGDIPAAIATIEAMVNDFDYVNAHVLTTLGFLYIIENKLDKALAVTEKSLEENPESSAAWDNMGQIYLRQDNLDKAQECFEKAVSYRDDLVDCHYYLGIIHEKRGDTEKARDCFTRARYCKISPLNTVKKEQVEEKYDYYERLRIAALERDERYDSRDVEQQTASGDIPPAEK